MKISKLILFILKFLKFLAVISFVALIMSGFFYLFQLTESQFLWIKPQQPCDLHQESCQVQLPEQGMLTFSISPHPIPFSDPINLQVQLKHFHPDRVEVDFAGRSGDTGYKRIALKMKSEGLYEATTDLTHCQEPEMDWQVTVLLEKDKDTYAIPFQVVTLREYKDGVSPTLTLAKKPQGGDFVLSAKKGEIRTLDYRGQILLIYFGYTFCPDICPTSLAFAGEALRKLKQDDLDQIEVFFVGVDPQRDTLEKLDKYSKYFHPKITGLSGDPQNLEQIAKSFGASFKVHAPKPGKNYYVVDHSADFYMVAPDGKFIGTIPHGTSPEKMAQILGNVVAENKVRKVK